MHRTEGEDYGADLNGAGKRGYKEANPPDNATRLPAEAMNAIQEEIANVIEKCGLSLSADAASDRAAGWEQLYNAIFKSQHIEADAIKNLGIPDSKIANLNFAKVFGAFTYIVSSLGVSSRVDLSQTWNRFRTTLESTGSYNESYLDALGLFFSTTYPNQIVSSGGYDYRGFGFKSTERLFVRTYTAHTLSGDYIEFLTDIKSPYKIVAAYLSGEESEAPAIPSGFDSATYLTGWRSNNKVKSSFSGIKTGGEFYTVRFIFDSTLVDTVINERLTVLAWRSI